MTRQNFHFYITVWYAAMAHQIASHFFSVGWVGDILLWDFAVPFTFHETRCTFSCLFSVTLPTPFPANIDQH